MLRARRRDDRHGQGPHVRLVTDHDREVTAWHESGHTLAAYLQEQADDPVQVTIIPRGPAGGVTWMSGNDDQFLPRRKAHAQLVTAMAGRAAEEILLDGEFTQGAAGDLQSATELAASMATRYGMTSLGYQFRRGGSAPDQDVSDVVEELLSVAHAAATKLLGEHKSFLGAVAAELLAEETLTLADVHHIATGLGVARYAYVPSPAARPAPRGQAGGMHGGPISGHCGCRRASGCRSGFADRRSAAQAHAGGAATPALAGGDKLVIAEAGQLGLSTTDWGVKSAKRISRMR